MEKNALKTFDVIEERSNKNKNKTVPITQNSFQVYLAQQKT